MISSSIGLANCRPVVNEVFVPAASIVNWLEKVICPDVSSRRRTYVPVGVNAYGLHNRNESAIPTAHYVSQNYVISYIERLQATIFTVFRLPVLVVSFCKVSVVVPEAPDQVTLKGAPAVIPASDGFLNPTAAAVLPIANAETRHICSNTLLLENVSISAEKERFRKATDFHYP